MELIIDRLCKDVPGKRILSDISFRVGPGECVALIGPNGAGKTSLIRCVLGVYTVSSGEIVLNGRKAGSRDYPEGLCDVSVVFDNLGLYRSLTAWENIEFFSRIHSPKMTAERRAEQIKGVLESFDLYDARDRKITFFSKGMKQRLALARALVTEPEFLILDEPFQGLDVDGSLLLQDYIQVLRARGVSILLSSHDLLIAEKLCDRFVFIRGGKLAGLLSKEELDTEMNSRFYVLPEGKGTGKAVAVVQDGEVHYCPETPPEFIRRLGRDEVDLELLYRAVMKKQ